MPAWLVILTILAIARRIDQKSRPAGGLLGYAEPIKRKLNERPNSQLHQHRAVASTLQLTMTATFGLDDFTRVWILVKLDLARPTRCFLCGCWCGTATGLWIQQADYVTQTEAELSKQLSQLCLKLNFFRQLRAALQCFELRR